MPVKRITPNRLFIVVTTAIFVSLFQLMIIPKNVSTAIHEAVDCKKHEFLSALRGPLSQDDPRLIEWVQGQIDHPSKKPYNLQYILSGLSGDSNQTYSPSQEFIYEAIYDIFNDMNSKGFFFVEAGAYDGEFLSNTLFLEKEAGWTGLLVEPNKKAYQKLLSKHRKAYSINACLSTGPFPSQVYFAEVQDTGKRDYILNRHPNSQTSEIDRKIAEHTGKASSRLVEYVNHTDTTLHMVGQELVQCLPLFTIARALNVRHIHLFSLDVEGAEMGILNTIPWNLLQFTMLVIEHVGDLKELEDYLKSKGYSLFRSQYPDYVFVSDKTVKLVKPNQFPDNKRKKYWRKH